MIRGVGGGGGKTLIHKMWIKVIPFFFYPSLSSNNILCYTDLLVFYRHLPGIKEPIFHLSPLFQLTTTNLGRIELA